MGEYPKTVQQFQDWFSTEDSCRDYLFRLRWPEGFQSPRCKNNRAWMMGRRLFRCTECDLETSITAGTLFQDTRKSLRLWFQAMWYVTNQKHGVSATGLGQALGLGSYQTAWMWLHKLRRAMVRPGRDRLQGTIEIDETFVDGPRPGKRGRGAEGKVLVLVAAQKDGRRVGRIRLRQINDASAESLEDEFTFRFNRRTSRSRGKLFFRLVHQAMAIDPVPAKSIVGGRPEL